ncbi:MAG: alginate lyase family protein, partial [Bacteroidales bacterium]|nr:alginate lyase family protein [Bacteroidales bacterium]
MKRILYSALVLLSCAFVAQGQQKPLLWNMERLYSVKTDETYSRTKNGYEWQAKSFLDAPDVVVTDKPAKFVNDTRYYVSMGTYWWPDPKNPGGPYIRKDGIVNPETRDYDAPKLTMMMRRVKAFAVAFYLTGDLAYKDAMLSQLRAWFLDPVTGMLPSFQYAQIHPGANGNIGNAAGLIDAYAFNDVLDAIRLVNSESSIDRKTMDGLKKWFGDFATWMMESYIGRAESYATNNHGIAYDVILANIA